MSFTDAGYGQQTPSDPNTEYTSIAFIVRSMMAKMDTMKLVKVTAVHGGGGAIAAAGTVDVQPLVNQIDGASPPHATPHGTVYGIPWWRLQGGSSAVICDPIVGDLGYVICADRDISVVKGTGAVGNPGSLRRFNIADGIYVGGCITPGTPTQYIAFTAQGITVSDLNGNVLKLTSAGIAITGNMAVTGNISATGTIVAGKGGADQVGLQTHLHTSAASGSPTSSPTPGS